VNTKKAKGKKAPDPNEASKLIAAKIEQLELDADKEKDQEAEIGACVPSVRDVGRGRMAGVCHLSTVYRGDIGSVLWRFSSTLDD
jgi:hypothetical protein